VASCLLDRLNLLARATRELLLLAQLLRETGLRHPFGHIGAADVAKVAHGLTGGLPQARPEDAPREPLPSGQSSVHQRSEPLQSLPMRTQAAAEPRHQPQEASSETARPLGPKCEPTRFLGGSLTA
jgi:hypothetical protein